MALSRKRLLIIVPLCVAVLCVAAVLVQRSRNPPRLEKTDELGTVWVYPSWWWLRGVAFVLSSSSGWSEADADAARSLAMRGYHVFGIDSGQLIAGRNARNDCVFLPSML